MIRWLKFGSLLMCLTMIGVLIHTSLQSNLITEWNSLAKIPWMKATLWDFYINMSLPAGWMLYKERHWPTRLLWLVGFIGLGSVATTFYLYRKLSSLRPGEGIDRLLSR